MAGRGNKIWITPENFVACFALLAGLGSIAFLTGFGESYKSIILEAALLANASLLIIYPVLVRANRKRVQSGSLGRERPLLLKEMLNRDDVRRMIMGGYKLDGYSLGIVKEATAEEGLAFELSVEGTGQLERFPRSVTID